MSELKLRPPKVRGWPKRDATLDVIDSIQAELGRQEQEASAAAITTARMIQPAESPFTGIEIPSPFWRAARVLTARARAVTLCLWECAVRPQL